MYKKTLLIDAKLGQIIQKHRAGVDYVGIFKSWRLEGKVLRGPPNKK